MAQKNTNLTKSSSKAKGNLDHKYITFKSLRNLRSWFKEASAQDINDVIKQLELLRTEKIKEEQDDNIRDLRFKEMWDHYATQGYSARMYLGLDPQEVLNALTAHFSCSFNSFSSAKVKYRYYDLEGNLCQWSGQGREPRSLRELLKITGKNKDDFLVKDENIKVYCSKPNNFENLSKIIDYKQSLYRQNALSNNDISSPEDQSSNNDI